MNPYYQYSIMKRYANADGEMASRIPATKTSESNQTSSKPIPIVEAAKQPASQPDDTTAPRPPVEEEQQSQPQTYTGEAQVRPIKEGTTINIFNPDGQTSTSTTAEDVSIDSGTGEMETGTSIGGGGGGFGGGGGEGVDAGKMSAPVKTWIPLIVIAAGIAVIILKPFKKKSA